MTIAYNTTEERLRLPQYGRLVQDMVDHALTLADKPARQAYAERIVKVMAQLNPQMRSTPNFRQTLWNHLAFMAGYKLDIDYPYEIEVAEERRPHKLSYPGNKIRFRHYGHLLEATLAKIKETPADAAGRDDLVRMAAVRMKRYLADWKGDGVENEKVGRDMAYYTDGAVSVNEVITILEQTERRVRPAAHVQQRYNRRGRR